MSGDQPFNAATPVAVGMGRAPREHDLKNVQQVLSNFEVRRIARVVERDQYLVGQPSGVAWQAIRRAGLHDLLWRGDQFVVFLLSYTVQNTPHGSERVN